MPGPSPGLASDSVVNPVNDRAAHAFLTAHLPRIDFSNRASDRANMIIAVTEFTLTAGRLLYIHFGFRCLAASGVATAMPLLNLFFVFTKLLL